MGRHAGLLYGVLRAAGATFPPAAHLVRATARQARQPGILARRSFRPLQPSHAWLHSGSAFTPRGGAWARFGEALPAYSGGTAWASVPLRMTTGQSRSRNRLLVSCSERISPKIRRDDRTTDRGRG